MQRPDRAGAAAELLFQLEQLLAGTGPARVGDLVDPALDVAATELAGLVRNVRLLRVDRLQLRYLDQAAVELTADQRTTYGTDAWVSEVQLTWRFRGVHPEPSTVEVPVVFGWDGEQAVFETARATEGYRVPLWFTEPLEVRRTPSTLVLATDARSARSLERLTRKAVVTVRRTLPRWRERLVVVAPDAVEDFRTAAGVSRAESRSIAAVTTTADGSSLPRTPVHIYLNPDVFGPLGPEGQQIVVSHEATHVALDAATTVLPLWLSEGIADYVALVGHPLPDRVLAAQIRELVRQDGPPRRLPGSAEFDGSNPDIGAWYEAAWLAVKLLAETYGRAKLLDFYDRAEADGSTGRAFRTVLGTSERDFTRAWRASLAELAR